MSRALLVALLAVMLNACIKSIGRTFGHSVASAGVDYLRSDSGRAAIRSFTDTSVQHAATAFHDHLEPALGSAAESLLARGQGALRHAEDSLAAQVAGPLSDAVSRLVRANVSAAGAEARTQLDLTARAVASTMERELTPALQRSVTAATRSFGTQLAVSVRTELKAAAESALAGAVRAGVNAGTTTAQKSPVWRTVLLIGGGLIAALVLVAIAWLVRQHRQNERALDAVAGAVVRSGTPELQQEIRDRAVDRNVDDWLARYVAKRRYVT